MAVPRSSARATLECPAYLHVSLLEEWISCQRSGVKRPKDSGAGKRGYCEAIVTVMVKNPKGLGRFS